MALRSLYYFEKKNRLYKGEGFLRKATEIYLDVRILGKSAVTSLTKCNTIKSMSFRVIQKNWRFTLFRKKNILTTYEISKFSASI